MTHLVASVVRHNNTVITQDIAFPVGSIMIAPATVSGTPAILSVITIIGQTDKWYTEDTVQDLVDEMNPQ